MTRTSFVTIVWLFLGMPLVAQQTAPRAESAPQAAVRAALTQLLAPQRISVPENLPMSRTQPAQVLLFDLN